MLNIENVLPKLKTKLTEEDLFRDLHNYDDLPPISIEKREELIRLGRLHTPGDIKKHNNNILNQLRNDLSIYTYNDLKDDRRFAELQNKYNDKFFIGMDDNDKIYVRVNDVLKTIIKLAFENNKGEAITNSIPNTSDEWEYFTRMFNRSTNKGIVVASLLGLSAAGAGVGYLLSKRYLRKKRGTTYKRVRDKKKDQSDLESNDLLSNSIITVSKRPDIQYVNLCSYNKDELNDSTTNH